MIKLYFFDHIRKSTFKVKTMLYFIQAKMIHHLKHNQSGTWIREALQQKLPESSFSRVRYFGMNVDSIISLHLYYL